MSWAPKGHARVNARSPRAFGICDCCGFQYNLHNLRWQMQYYGTQLRRTGYRHCPTCLDVPSIQRPPPYKLPPDPVPVDQPRKEYPRTPLTFDPFDRGATADVSDDFFTVTAVPLGVPDVGIASSLIGQTQGKWYAEARYDSAGPGAAFGVIAGNAIGGVNVSGFLGSDPFGWGWLASGVFMNAGQVIPFHTYPVGAVMQLAYNAGSLYFGQDNSWVTDPVVGIPTFTEVGLNGFVNFACSVGTDGFSANAQFTLTEVYQPPDGYMRWAQSTAES